MAKNKNENIDKDCVSDGEKYKDGPFEAKDVTLDGTYKEHKSPKEKILQQMYTIKLNVN